MSARRQRRTRVAVLASHPIQYHLPWFRALNAVDELDLRVYFTLVPDPEQQGVGFDVPFTWDLPLLEGYPWRKLPLAPSRPRLDSFFGNRLKRPAHVISRWRPHVAILTGWQNLGLIQALLACRRLTLPRLIRGEANALRNRPWPKRLGHRLLLRQFHGFLAIGRANRDFYLANGVDATRVFDCPYFVDNERFVRDAASLAGERPLLRQRWGIGAEDSCFLFAGKLTQKKRIMDLLAALRRARALNPAIHLLIAGDGEQMPEARRAVTADSLSVTFAGFLNQSEIAQAYVASDCLVLPSNHGETWGLVVNEAMACARPAIVSDRVGCGPDLVVHGSTGFVFPFGDIEALATTLVEVASDRERLVELGRRARSRVLESYSVEKAVEGTVAAVRAASSRPRP